MQDSQIPRFYKKLVVPDFSRGPFYDECWNVTPRSCFFWAVGQTFFCLVLQFLKRYETIPLPQNPGRRQTDRLDLAFKNQGPTQVSWFLESSLRTVVDLWMISSNLRLLLTFLNMLVFKLKVLPWCTCKEKKAALLWWEESKPKQVGVHNIRALQDQLKE